MGILREVAALVKSLPLPRPFDVCELGDQMMSGGKTPTPAKVFYQSIGCRRYEAIDANGRGTITGDLNRPFRIGGPLQFDLPRFDLVTDFGTGEHIFDQAQVWRTVHDLTRVGGLIAFDRPGQGYRGHGFYRTDPCLFRDIADTNGYRLVYLVIAETPRGELVRGVFQRQTDLPFRVPQQGRYRATLRVGSA